MSQAHIDLAYLVASVLFILGLKGLTSPKTAPRGNLLGATGMLVAVVATLLDRQIVDFTWILVGFAVGAVIGTVLALKIQMTAMPQLVALFNGFGGAASALVAAAALVEADHMGDAFTTQLTVSIVASALIGAVTFTGSVVAFAKLQELISGKPIRLPGHHALNALMFVGALAASVWVVVDPPAFGAFWVVVALASILGVTLVVPIGGADMPVVIALLNSYSGLAAAATGFVLHNNVLIIAGSLVGASGVILTQIMCRAMNRSLLNVMFGGFGEEVAGGPSADDVYEGRVKSATPEEAAMILDAARSVIFVPGYGMAVAQAQHAVSELARLLKGRGVDVKFAIHPVAGRMPGHMNVLLAEADVPYEDLYDLDEINPLFPQTDVAIVLGANDVVNPLAREDPNSPIYGMPILDVDKAKTVMVIKRSLSPGFAGIPNPLFANDNTLMIFGDAKQVLRELIAELKELS